MSVFNPFRYRLFALLTCILLVAGVASAGVITTIYTSIGPAAPQDSSEAASASYQAYTANALYALQNGLTSYGDPTTPGYYQQTASYTPGQLIGTGPYTDPALGHLPGFNSWNGQTSPTGNYANEFGNAVFFGMVVDGGGTQFSLNDVSFVDNFYGLAPYTFLLNSVPYGFRLVGVSGANTYGGTTGLTTGTASTPVDKIYFSGFWDAFYVSDSSKLTTALGQITDASTPTAGGTLTAEIGGQTFTGTKQAEAVPEPATLTFAGLGLVIVGIAGRKRRKS